jgi:hypothetical protein
MEEGTSEILEERRPGRDFSSAQQFGAYDLTQAGQGSPAPEPTASGCSNVTPTDPHCHLENVD